jgi:CBS domain-containing protein
VAFVAVEIEKVGAPPDVVTVTADASHGEVVALMDRHRISALPVVDAAGRCVGIVTSGDLILKQDPEVRDSGPPPGIRAHVEQVKAAATTAGMLMTAPVMMVRRHHTVAQAVRLLHHFNIKHLPGGLPAERPQGLTGDRCAELATPAAGPLQLPVQERPLRPGDVEALRRHDDPEAQAP